jgi:hypothetical protein
MNHSESQLLSLFHCSQTPESQQAERHKWHCRRNSVALPSRKHYTKLSCSVCNLRAWRSRIVKQALGTKEVGGILKIRIVHMLIHTDD